MRTRLTRLETYVLGHTMVAVLGALTIISSIIVLVDFVELSRSKQYPSSPRTSSTSFAAVQYPSPAPVDESQSVFFPNTVQLAPVIPPVQTP